MQRATYHHSDNCGRVVVQVVEGELLISDPDTVWTAARTVFGQLLSCRDGVADRGIVMRVAGDAIGADRLPPNMVPEDFLKCLSRESTEPAALVERILPRTTGTATLIMVSSASTFDS